MSGIYNPDLQFSEPGPRMTLSSPYRDAQGNWWRIDVTGDPEAVVPFAESKGLIVEAIPMTAEEYAVWAEKERGAWQSSLEEHLSAPTLHTASPQAQQQQEASVYQQTPTPPQERPPVMSMAIILLELAQEGPHRLRFEVDPEIYSWSSPQTVSFLLKGGDITPNVTLNVSHGSAWLSLDGGGNYWVATITWGSGAPAYYTLRGDVVRN